MKSKTLRHTWALFAGALIFAAAGSARAQDAAAACINDPDCPDMTCGGQVCQYGADGQKCVPAGTGPKKMDGWCSSDADCKCKSLGAKCAGVYCTFTKPGDAPAGAGTGGSGGSGATGTGGSTATGTGGTTAAPAPAADSGGCAISRTPAAGLTSAGLLVGLGAIAFGARRRRRAA